jgi:hypothetical protein
MVDTPSPAAKLMTTLCGIVWAVLVATPLALSYAALRLWYLVEAPPFSAGFADWLGPQGVVSWPILLPAVGEAILIGWLLKTL